MSLVYKTPKILAHVSALDQGNFVTPEYILNKGENIDINLFRRYCPHRLYPLEEIGSVVDGITCKFHNFKWDKNGDPINNPKKIKCGQSTVSQSGLIYKDYDEPNTYWSQCLSAEKNLQYSHSVVGSSLGSWLWLMEAEADLLHLYLGGIHPFLARQINLEEIELDQGDGWILQIHPNGWWLYIFPYVFVEYSPGCLMVNYVTPKDEDCEFGYDWICQFYYDPTVSVDKRYIFETLVEVFKQDIETTEKQKGPYFPSATAMNKYEYHCVHFGEWYRKNKKM